MRLEGIIRTMVDERGMKVNSGNCIYSVFCASDVIKPSPQTPLPEGEGLSCSLCGDVELKV